MSRSVFGKRSKFDGAGSRIEVQIAVTGGASVG